MMLQIQMITAAWLIMSLHAVTVTCSNDTGAESKHRWFNELQLRLMMTRGGLYQGESAPLLAPTPGKISQRCMEDLKKLQNPAEYGNDFRALDAFGKPKAGFAMGSLAWLGNYDECMALEGFNYCLADMLVNGTALHIPGVQTFLIRWGICPPASCSNQDLRNALQDLLGFLDGISASFKAVSAAAVTCSESPPIPYSTGVICTIILLSSLGVLMVIGSLYDEYLKLKAKMAGRERRCLYCQLQNQDMELEEEDDDDDPLLLQDAPQRWPLSIHHQEAPQGFLTRFLLCFAATRNLSKLLDTQQKDTSIGALNGIRVISMTWVILCHTLFFTLYYGTMQNSPTLYSWLGGHMGFQVISNGYFSVDSFFFLSGFLVSYLALSRMQELMSVKAWAWFYFHRYWRLTPLLGVTILVWMFIQPFFGDSPIWYTTLYKSNCQQYWWTNLLYINNFYPQGFTTQCIGWTWYLANDMQFFIISPFLLVPLYYAPVFGAIAVSSLTIVSVVVTAVIMIVYNSSVDILGMAASAQRGYGLDDSSLVYSKPYCRIAPYLVGMALGYIMHRIGKRRVKMSPLLAIVGWIVAAGIAMSVVYGFYPSYHSGIPVTRAGQVVYGSVARFAWGVSLMWVVYACKYGYGGWINGFLSWTGWIPLSRLTYAAYLFHPIVFITFYTNFGTSIYESKYLLVYYFAGNLLLAYFIALFVALAVEYPLANLEKLFMPNNPKAKQERHHGDQVIPKL